MKPKFVNCGFEFTAGIKKGGRIKSSSLYIDSYDRYCLRYRWNLSDKISNYKWINDNYESDVTGCEVPTPIVKKKIEVTKYFNDFNSFVKKTNLTLDINKARCVLGGCHIHLDVSQVSINKRKQLIRNIAILLTNYPQLNWGFNDVNDNINANSLLTASGLSIEDTLVWNTDGAQINLENNPLINLFLNEPLNIVLKKKFAIRYNQEYKTVEFRIFDMPKNLKQHLLHHDVAVAIYNYCLNLTNKGIKLKLEYKKLSDYNFTLKESIIKFNEILTLLKIDTSRTNRMVKNIKVRYSWNKNKYLI